ncbi:myb family transcription factor PHL8-like isoform X2 [Camellia sinensis]|uniref:myb family transcription factor PHL8-like isoform X2 n=1 Tax=Camellia sinensis TaxID=4442 RepID=UPI0010355E48|nr:myb family transcription factor PHL8-like isoform X2 [Camellia sinensis]
MNLTIFVIKVCWCSLLQKYRLGKSQQSETYHDNKQEDFFAADDKLNQRRDDHFSGEVGDATQNQNNGMPMARALQMQMDVQRKLHEQIEVQRHLQLRIEAQGKYLQSVLKKAQETLSGYDSSSVGVELAKAELYQLVSMVDNGCLSSSLSVQKDIRCSSSKYSEKSPMGGTGCSLESSFTSSESSGQKEEKKSKHEWRRCQFSCTVTNG